MRKLLKSRKALSPVIAAIILIAVTVAVSIAVAAWMGSLSMGFMETKEITINKLEFTTGSVAAYVTNTGTSDVTIGSIKVNGETAGSWASGTSDTVEPAGQETFTVSMTIADGQKYSVSLFATDGTLVGSYTDTAPA